MTQAVGSPSALSERFLQALELAADLFRDKTRDMSGAPYAVHLYGVCHIVAQHTQNEDVQIAALLHDVLEDIDPKVYGAPELRRDFGGTVLELVQTVTHDERIYSKDESRRQYLKQLSEGPVEASIISAADMLYNGTDMERSYTQDPQTAAARFGGEKGRRRIWFWEQRAAIITRRLGHDHALAVQANSLLANASWR